MSTLGQNCLNLVKFIQFLASLSLSLYGRGSDSDSGLGECLRLFKIGVQNEFSRSGYDWLRRSGYLGHCTNTVAGENLSQNGLNATTGDSRLCEVFSTGFGE